jgi:hypothetical protein
VFVTGTSYGGSSNRDFATIAYNAQTGARQWAKRFTGPAAGNDYAKSIGVSPDAATVFVTGTGQTAAGPDYLTLAYQAATGATAWTGRYNGPAGLDDDAAAMAVPRSGHRLFVTGTSADNPSYRSYATIAYRT